MLGVSQHMGVKLFGREIIFEEFQRMWSRYLIVTDGRQTDGQTKAISISSRGKNRSQGNVAAENELGFH